MRIITLSVLLVLIPNLTTFAKAGPPIPIPQHSLTQAVEMVEAHFYETFPDGKRFTESNDFKIKDFIVISAEYTRIFGGKEFKAWSWVVTFRPPIHNDNSFTFQLDPNGKVILLQQTE